MAKRLRDVCGIPESEPLWKSRTLINFIVAADVSRLKLLTRRNNERTHVRCYGIYATEPEHRPCPLENSRTMIGIDISPMPAASWPNAGATFAACRSAVGAAYL
jgi:hypothetical protein